MSGLVVWRWSYTDGFYHLLGDGERVQRGRALCTPLVPVGRRTHFPEKDLICPRCRELLDLPTSEPLREAAS